MRIEVLLIFFFLVSCSIRQEQEDGENFFLGEESDEIVVPNITDNNEQPDDVTEEEDFSNLEDKTALFKGTYTESYASEKVACGSDLISFPDHSLVMKFNIGNKAFFLNNLYQQFHQIIEGAISRGIKPVTGLDLDYLLGRQYRLNLPLGLSEGEFVYIDWGDGTCQLYYPGQDIDHLYKNKNMYQVRVIGTASKLGAEDKTSYVESLIYASSLYEVVELGDLGWQNFRNAFSKTIALESLEPSIVIHLRSLTLGQCLVSPILKNWTYLNSALRVFPFLQSPFLGPYLGCLLIINISRK